MATSNAAGPVHPGEILRTEFLEALDVTPSAVARACRVPRTRIGRLAREETPVTADTALRLAAYFGTSACFWMNLLARYDPELTPTGIAEDIADIPEHGT